MSILAIKQEHKLATHDTIDAPNIIYIYIYIPEKKETIMHA